MKNCINLYLLMCMLLTADNTVAQQQEKTLSFDHPMTYHDTTLISLMMYSDSVMKILQQQGDTVLAIYEWGGGPGYWGTTTAYILWQQGRRMIAVSQSITDDTVAPMPRDIITRSTRYIITPGGDMIDHFFRQQQQIRDEELEMLEGFHRWYTDIEIAFGDKRYRKQVDMGATTLNKDTLTLKWLAIIEAFIKEYNK